MVQKILDFLKKNPTATQETQTYNCDFSRLCKYEELLGENFLDNLEREKPIQTIESQNIL